jgi:hypothetical protein
MQVCLKCRFIPLYSQAEHTSSEVRCLRAGSAFGRDNNSCRTNTLYNLITKKSLPLRNQCQGSSQMHRGDFASFSEFSSSQRSWRRYRCVDAAFAKLALSRSSIERILSACIARMYKHTRLFSTRRVEENAVLTMPKFSYRKTGARL